MLSEISIEGSVNQRPVSNAGADRTITLPTDTIILSGSGTDSDGSIASYSWWQAFGPSVATFSSNSVASPAVSNLVEGTYCFSLYVTDNAGLTSLADSAIVVVAPPSPSSGNASLSK